MPKHNVLDFNAAYARRHGGQPNPRRAEGFWSKISHVLPANAPIEIDLEKDRREHRLLKSVTAGDSLAIKAGRTSFEMVFADVDGNGCLECLTFKDGCHSGSFKLSPGASWKAWGGMLMDFSQFSVRVERLTGGSGEAGTIASVLVHVVVDSTRRFSVPGLRLDIPDSK